MTVNFVDALAPRPAARSRTNTRDAAAATYSIALTDYTLGETDVDDDAETVLTKRNGSAGK